MSTRRFDQDGQKRVLGGAIRMVLKNTTTTTTNQSTGRKFSSGSIALFTYNGKRDIVVAIAAVSVVERLQDGTRSACLRQERSTMQTVSLILEESARTPVTR